MGILNKIPSYIVIIYKYSFYSSWISSLAPVAVPTANWGRNVPMHQAL